eukprot:125310-Chlamydomonas_euryale.AAC.3
MSRDQMTGCCLPKETAKQVYPNMSSCLDWDHGPLFVNAHTRCLLLTDPSSVARTDQVQDTKVWQRKTACQAAYVSASDPVGAEGVLREREALQAQSPLVLLLSPWDCFSYAFDSCRHLSKCCLGAGRRCQRPFYTANWQDAVSAPPHDAGDTSKPQGPGLGPAVTRDGSYTGVRLCLSVGRCEGRPHGRCGRVEQDHSIPAVHHTILCRTMAAPLRQRPARCLIPSHDSLRSTQAYPSWGRSL